MNDTQLELSLGSVLRAQSPRGARRPNKHTTGWWFQQMRQIVDRAFDWQPAPPPPPEQIWLPGTHRQANVSS